jgi:hypothetical protein
LLAVKNTNTNTKSHLAQAVYQHHPKPSQAPARRQAPGIVPIPRATASTRQPTLSRAEPTPLQLAAENPVLPYGDTSTRRYTGFGARSTARSCSHDVASAQYILHLAWGYMDPAERMIVIRVVPHMRDYARLRFDAHKHRATIIEALQAARLPPEIEPKLCPWRARFMGAALLSFDFDYGDLVRWLSGEYTNAHRDWDELSGIIDEVRQHQQRPGYPEIEYNLALEACTQGVPLEGHFECDRTDVEERLRYDNHAPLAAAEGEARTKLGKEEANSYHIAFPRFLAYFLFGLFICPISWLVQKGKGRLIMDGSIQLHKGDTGAPNDSIPKAGKKGSERTNPPVFYGTAVNRITTTIWNKRIDHPRKDILLHSDDIDAAFRRCLYHPDLAIAFAAVFFEFLMIPVGMIFGSRSSPSWWCIPAELRAHRGATADFSDSGPCPLANNVKLADPPTQAETVAIVQAVPDAMHNGTPPEFCNRRNHIMFVDDNFNIEIDEDMREALRGAEKSAYEFFGHPDNDRRGSCLQTEKFPDVATFWAIHLGYLFNTRKMQVDWPMDKQARLLLIVTEWLHNRSARTPTEIATLLGLMRHGAYLCPLGEFLSIRLQLTLSAAVTAAGPKALTNKRWWKFHRVSIPADILAADLTMLATSLMPSPEHEGNSIWSRPIALLVQREWTCQVLSDAAYTGIGGWSPTCKFMWRITRSELIEAGLLTATQQEQRLLTTACTSTSSNSSESLSMSGLPCSIRDKTQVNRADTS